MNNFGIDSPNNDDTVVHITWTVPGSTGTHSAAESSSLSNERNNNHTTSQQQPQPQPQPQNRKRIQRCVDLAISCATDFNANFQIYNIERENSIPRFHPQEIVVVPPEEELLIPTTMRMAGFYKEYILRNIQLLPEKKDGINDPSNAYYKTKKHFATWKQPRVSATPTTNTVTATTTTTTTTNGHQYYYSIKMLQDGIMETDHGPHATTEMIVETKLLMNLSIPQHPHIMKLYGITSSSISSVVSSSSSVSNCIINGHGSYFFITDRIYETLTERMEMWRHLNNNLLTLPSSTITSTSTTAMNNNEDQKQPPHITKRLEIALDIASALIFLHDRNIVYYIRPDKIGFDLRCGVVKLCYFGQCRQHNMESNPRSVTQSDNMNVLAYTAPEVFCMAPARTVADVYGFGILLWEMITLQRPYYGYDRCQHFEHVVRNHIRPFDMKNTNHDENDWDVEIAKVIQHCIRPYERPTMKQIHTTLETKLLYYEPPMNDILDTAQRIQYRHSARIVEQFRILNDNHNELQEMELPATTISNSITEPRQQQLSRLSKDFESRAKNSKVITQQSKVKADEGDGKLNSSFEALNASGNSIMSTVSLEALLKDVSEKLSGGPGGEQEIDAEVPTRRSSKDLNKVCQHNVSPRSRDRLQNRRPSRTINVKTRRSNGRSGSAKQRTNDIIPSELNNQLEKVRTDSTDDYQERGDFGDDEDLIASIMSQSDATSVSVMTNGRESTKNYPLKVAKSKNSFLGSKSPTRLRQRSRSRSKSRSRSFRENIPKLLPVDNDGSIAESELATTSPTKPKLKLSPTQAASQNAARIARAKSNPRSSREKHPPKTLSRSDSDSTLGIRRKRRASVTEVKEKFDFVPDSPRKNTSQKDLNGLQKALERASSPIRATSPHFRKEKYPLSSTNNIVQAGKNLLNGVFRRGSGKDVLATTRGSDKDVVETAPIRRQMRRGSASLVQDIVQQQSSTRIINRKSSSWREGSA